jgi:replicative DNA helicase
MTEEVKEEYQHWENKKKAHEILEESGVEPVMVDPLITTKVAYVENLQQEIQNLQEQMASLQYQLDIRVTALTMYQSTLEVKEEPKKNGEDKVNESNS